MEVTLFTNCLLFVIGVIELEVIQRDVGIDKKIGGFDRRCLFWRFGRCCFTLKRHIFRPYHIILHVFYTILWNVELCKFDVIWYNMIVTSLPPKKIYDCDSIVLNHNS